MLWKRKLNEPGLPRWPKVYRHRNGTMSVSGRHATIGRYKLVRLGIVVATLCALACVCAIGLSVFDTYGHFPGLRSVRLNFEDFLIRRFPYALAWLPGNRDGLPWRQDVSGWAYVVIAAAVLVAWFVAEKLNRPLLSGWLFAKRTTVKITPKHVVLYRFRLYPQRWRRDSAASIKFRNDVHPKLKRQAPAGGPQNHALLGDTGSVEMIYDLRRVPIALVLGLYHAEQYAICCGFAHDGVKQQQASTSATIDASNVRVI